MLFVVFAQLSPLNSGEITWTVFEATV